MKNCKPKPLNTNQQNKHNPNKKEKGKEGINPDKKYGPDKSIFT